MVSDQTGGVLPGVTVVATGPAMGDASRVAVTDADGRYAYEALPPGVYTLAFTLPGFEELARSVELAAAGAPVVDVRLRLGGLFEEVTVAVTGTSIEAPAINMPHAVTVVTRATIEQQGSTQLVDLFRNLSVSHGVVGERNSWYNANQPSTLTENVANVNLRGLGASRTLVLLNGRRHVPVPARLIGGRFVDVNTIPAIAIGRLEVLKEGSAAVYGSDAVGGVANFVTRSDFRGFELNVSHDYFDSAGDTTVAGIWGGRIGSSSLVFAADRVGRQELQMADRPWTLDRFGRPDLLPEQAFTYNVGTVRQLRELHLVLRRPGRQHHRAAHRPVPDLGRELPVALPGQRHRRHGLRAEPDRHHTAVGQHRAVVRRLHARPEGAQVQGGADLSIRRLTATRPTSFRWCNLPGVALHSRQR